jgi:radical SAM superfamily enzyme YgiQ (UPF0313 family)
MKVVTVGINSKFIHTNLAIRYLKAFTEDLDYECKVREFSINDRSEKVVQELIHEKADMIAFSCYIWNIEFINELINVIRLIDENIEILVGGPEVSYESRNFIENNNIDYLIEGEGEETYRELIEAKIEGIKPIKPIKGLYAKYNNEIHYGGRRELMNMSETVFPYNEKDAFENKIVYYEASRGCPYNCIYCLSSTIHGVRFLSLDRVKEELRFLMDKKVALIKFVDRTFNCKPEFAMEIWKYLIQMNTDTRFHFEISADIFNDEEIKLLLQAPANRFQFEIGVQTTNDIVLENINRHVKFEDIKRSILQLKKNKGIKLHLDLIAGLPGENFESFANSFNEIYALNPDEIQLGFLKLLKGSRMREEAPDWDIVYSPYPPYEVLKTSKLSYDEIVILKRIEEVFDRYYNSGKFSNILKFFCSKFNSPFEFFMRLSEYYYEKGYYNINLSFADYYRVFIDFNDDFTHCDTDIVNDIVKYDYIAANKKSWIPDFIKSIMTKDEEKEIKLKAKLMKNKLNDKAYIERFNTDIQKYFKEGKIEKGTFYFIYDVSGQIYKL